MHYRKLRIAWSAAWGVVAVSLCVLWVRSYLDLDDTYFWTPGGVVSHPGSLLIGQREDASPYYYVTWALAIPYWLAVVATAGFASLPWLRWRFSPRIAWSVAWGVVSVLLVVFWVRSYLDSSDYFVVNHWRYEADDGYIQYWFWEPRNGSEPPDPRFPIAIPVFVAATAAPISWLRLRFSLRTLLIATTLVAAALGLIVWAAV
jgi:hypothetical protein